VTALASVDVLRWVSDHRTLGVRPTMSHDRIWNDGFLVMLFDGPTPKDRSDFHINSSPEFFYQLVGEMRCRVVEESTFRDFVVGEGEMFLLPANVPHLNTRDHGSMGIVVHQQRPPGALDAIVWYCEGCAFVLHRIDYRFEDLRAQLPVMIREFLGNAELRTCKQCGRVMEAERGAM
jgi:3-hydroxyanthranilate 3,4-dioxygenase